VGVSRWFLMPPPGDSRYDRHGGPRSGAVTGSFEAVPPERRVSEPVNSSAWGRFRCRAVGVPHLVAHDINAATREVLFSCSLVVIIVAVIPWRYVSTSGHPGMLGVDEPVTG
jgi:hypothetical protein